MTHISNRVVCIICSLIVVLFLGSVRSDAQVLRMGASIHYGLIRIDEIGATNPSSRLMFDVSGDLELVHRVLYFTSTAALYAPGFSYGTESSVTLDVGAFFYPIRKWPIYVSTGFGFGLEGARLQVGLGAFFPISKRLELRTKFNTIGITSVGVGVAYSIFDDYEIAPRPFLASEGPFYGDVNVNATPEVAYVRKGRDCDVHFTLSNTTMDSLQDVLLDVVFYTDADNVLESRLILASEAIAPASQQLSHDYELYDLVGTARYIDATSLGGFAQLSETQLSDLHITAVDNTQMKVSIPAADVILGRHASFVPVVTNGTGDVVTTAILQAEMIDSNGRVTQTRHFSVNEQLSVDESRVCKIVTVYDIPRSTARIRVSPAFVVGL